MSIRTRPSAPSAAAPPESDALRLADRLYRLSVDQYQQIAQAGILTNRDRVELLEGLLVTKMTKHPPHVLSANLAYRALDRALPAGWYVAKEDPVVIPPRSEPEPDVSVVRGDLRDYGNRKPGAGDVALVVEVADSSLDDDRNVKKTIYARGSIPTYWIVNLPDRIVEVYTDPTGPADAPDYRHRQDYGPDDEVPLVIEGREVARIAVRDLLP